MNLLPLARDSQCRLSKLPTVSWNIHETLSFLWYREFNVNGVTQ